MSVRTAVIEDSTSATLPRAIVRGRRPRKYLNGEPKGKSQRSGRNITGPHAGNDALPTRCARNRCPES